MDHPTCPHCRGARTITVHEGKLMQGHGYCFRHPLITVPINHRCPTCRGTGRVATADLIAAEQRSIAADKAAWEATLPDHFAASVERIAAGEQPF